MPDIWSDPDVSRIASYSGGQPNLNLGVLDDEERSLMMHFIVRDREVGNGSSAQQIIAACVAGVQAFDGLVSLPSAHRLTGWRKFITYNVGCDVQILWSEHQKKNETAIFGDWVVATIAGDSWGPDGNRSALGSVHSNCLAVAAQAGGGVRINPATGKFEPPTGDVARRYRPA